MRLTITLMMWIRHMNDTQFTIGKLLDGSAPERDAIHIAVARVTAGERLQAGDEVGFAYGSTSIVKRREAVYALKPIGIIDPFLRAPEGWSGEVPEGQQCWLFLFPNTITDMRHEWQHPAFNQAPATTNESEMWLHQFADRWNFDYDEMITNASAKPDSEWGNYVVAQGIDLHSSGELGDDHALFWHHLAKMTGKAFSQEHIDKFVWSCTC